MQFDIITIFPEVFKPYFATGMIRCAQKRKIVNINLHNLRDFTDDERRTVDDRPYSGGPGMILKVEPIYRALETFLQEQKGKKVKNLSRVESRKQKIIILDPAGKKFDQKMAKRFSKLDKIVLLCGRYEGFDKRVYRFINEKISVGDYVLTGGELPAMILVDAVTRLIPGVLNKEEALFEETHSKKGYIEYPQYTRPEVFKLTINNVQFTNKFKNSKTKYQTLKVPKILLSGDHKKIDEWKRKHAKLIKD